MMQTPSISDSKLRGATINKDWRDELCNVGDSGSSCPDGQWAQSPTQCGDYPTCLLEPEMTIEQLQKLVCDFGLEACAPYTSQTQLIRLIQLQCGDEPCFSSEKRYGCSEVCEWSGECRKLKAKWLY